MDPRIREQAEILATHSTDLSAGDNVVILAPPAAEDLVVALNEVIGDVGAKPLVMFQSGRAERAYLRACDTFETPAHHLSMMEAVDVYVRIGGTDNVAETSDVDPDTQQARSRAHQPILDERLGKRWCVTQFPVPGNAQLAEMSTEAYENFVWDAVNKDWDAQRAFQDNMVEILDTASEVRIVSGDHTDIALSIEGNHTINDFGERNLPGGEVFTAPVPDRVNGSVLFDLPVYHQGREVENAYLEFEDGEVVDYAADRNEAVLTGILETDAGARRLGELGIGMNRDIDRFTYNTLFDEKMGDTVHMALGRAYDMTVGEGIERNESATHVDMIVDMSENSRIEVDGEIVQQDGRFRFED